MQLTRVPKVAMEPYCNSPHTQPVMPKSVLSTFSTCCLSQKVPLLHMPLWFKYAILLFSPQEDAYRSVFFAAWIANEDLSTRCLCGKKEQVLVMQKKKKKPEKAGVLSEKGSPSHVQPGRHLSLNTTSLAACLPRPSAGIGHSQLTQQGTAVTEETQFRFSASACVFFPLKHMFPMVWLKK